MPPGRIRHSADDARPKERRRRVPEAQIGAGLELLPVERQKHASLARLLRRRQSSSETRACTPRAYLGAISYLDAISA